MKISIIGISKEETEEYEDIIRCLNNLYRTIAGTMPGDRDFGISIAPLDDVGEEMEPTYTLEIMEKTPRYEPRVDVSEVKYEHGIDGSCKVTVIVEKRADRWQTS